MRAQDRYQTIQTAIAVSLLVHLCALYFVDIDKPEPLPEEEEEIMELALLADPLAGSATEEAEQVDTTAPATPPPPTPPTPPQAQAQVRPRTPTTTKLPEHNIRPSVSAPQPAESRPPSPPSSTSFRDWQARQNRGMPGLGARTPTIRGLGGQGADRARSRGTKQCLPRGDRVPEVVYLLVDSSGSMSTGWGAQAISCAQQYASAAIAAGAMVSVGNFADRTTFTRPSRDLMDVGAAIRGRDNGQGTSLPASELGPLFDAHTHLKADLVLLSDGHLPNYHEAMPWYRYFLDINKSNRGYLYSIGFAAPREVTAAFEQTGFEVFIYRLI